MSNARAWFYSQSFNGRLEADLLPSPPINPRQPKCQCCQKPVAQLVRHPDGWLICVECDTCSTCGERARNCGCIV